MTVIRRWFIDWANASGAGGGGTSTLYFESGTGTTVQTARVRDILTAWAGFAHADYSASIQSTVDEIDDATGLIVAQPTITPGTPIVGTGVGFQTPNQAQVVAALKTGTFVNGRRLQGRTFFPGVDSASVVNGQFDVSAGTNLVLELTGNGVVVFSPTWLTSALVSTAVIGAEIKVLRSRRD